MAWNYDTNQGGGASAFTPMDLSYGANSAAGGAAGAGGGFNMLNPFSWFNGNNAQGNGAATTPASQLGGGAAGLPFGMNLGTGQLAVSGLGTLGNLWTAWNATKLANQEFDFQKKLGTANLTNQVQSYNTALGDRATSRAVQNNQSPESAQAYIAANKLTTGGI